MIRAASSLGAVGRIARAAVLVFGVGMLGFVLCRRGIVLSDEGYLLLQSYDLLHGKVLYRDLDSFVAPGVWFLLATLFSVVEPSVLATRGAALLCYLANAYLIYRIVTGISGVRYAAAALAAYAVCSVWAFPAWSFSFYSPYSVLFAIAALERLLAWGESKRRRNLLAAGAAVGLSITFKQNYGAFAAIAVAVGVLAFCLERERRIPAALRRTVLAGLWVMAGTAMAIAPAIAYFASHGALGEAYQSLFIAPFTEFATRHAIPYMPLSELWNNTLMVGANRLNYGAYPLTSSGVYMVLLPPAMRSLVALLHVGAYWLPPLILAGGVCVALRRSEVGARDPRLASITAMAGLVFLGVFPRADYPHLMHVYQPIVLLGAIVVEQAGRVLRSTRPLAAFTVPNASAVVLALYAFVAVGWLGSLVTSQTARLVNERGGVMLRPVDAAILNFEAATLREKARPGEAVLTMPALAMLNFLAERPIPGKYYNLYGVHVAHDQGRGVVTASEAAGVDAVIAHYYNFFSDAGEMKNFAPDLVDYVRRTFRIEQSVGQDTHMLMARRLVPLPQVPAVDFRAACDVGGAAIGDRVVLPYLLFDSLYHTHGLGDVRGFSRRDTFCRMRLDEGNRLYFMVDYRRPNVVDLPSVVRVSVWVLAGSDVDRGRHLLPADLDSGVEKPRLNWERSLDPAEGLATPGPEEYVLDVSDYRDEEVVIVLRSEFEGAVTVNPSDYRGFGVSWHDLRIGHEDLEVALTSRRRRPEAP